MPFRLLIGLLAAVPCFGEAILFDARELMLHDAVVANKLGEEGIQFTGKQGNARAEFVLGKDAEAEVWVRARFRWCGDGVKVSVDGRNEEKLPTLVKGQNVWRDTGKNDNENSEVWHWVRTKPRALKRGKHVVRVTTVSGECGAEWISKVAVVYGTVGWSVPEIGGPCAALWESTRKAKHVLRTGGTAILEAEGMELVSGTLTEDGVRLADENSYLAGILETDAEQDCELWVRLYYENKNIFEPPELQEYSQAVYLTIDGAMAKTFYETDERRWHWVCAGKQRLTRGKHSVLLHKRGNPVVVDKVVFYGGEDHFKANWFTEKQPHKLPFGLANEVAFDDAKRAGDWRIFGSLASYSEGRWLGLRDGRVPQPTELRISGRGLGTVVLEKLRPIASNHSRVRRRREQQVSLWVKGDGTGARLSAILLDASGEAFLLKLGPRINWEGWKLLSASVPRGPSAAMLHEGGGTNGQPDYPLRLSHIVIGRDESKRVSLVFGEPRFESPFEARVTRLEIKEISLQKKNKKGEAVKDESQAEARAAISVRNATENGRTAILCFRFAPFGSRHCPTRPDGYLSSRNVSVPGGGTESLELTYRFPRESGVHVLEYAVNTGDLKRMFFVHGKGSRQELAALRKKLEREHGAYRFSPDGKDKPVLKPDGAAVAANEVASLYGKIPGFTILVDGVDVASRAHADSLNLRHRLKPRAWDLSDAAGWPDIRIPAGVVAIDPSLGRFKFCEGDAEPMVEAGRALTGFGVPGGRRAQIRGNYLYSCPGEGELTVIDISDPPNAKVIGFGLSWYFYRQLYFYRNLAYFRSALRGLVCWDDFSNPSRIGHMRSVNLDRDTFGSLWEPEGSRLGTFEEEGIAYTTTHVLDLADPLNPRPIREHGLDSLWRPEGSRYGLTYQDERKKIAVVDLRDPRNPKIIGKIGNRTLKTEVKGKETERLYGIAAICRDYFLLRSGDHLAVYKGVKKPKFVSEMIFDIPEEKITKQGPRRVKWHLSGFGFYRGHLYIIDGRIPANQNYTWKPDFPHSRVHVYKIGKELKKVGYWEDPFPTNYHHLTIDKKGFGYTTDMNFGIHVLDLRDPSMPKRVHGVPIASEVRNAGIGEKCALIGQYFGGAMIVADITDPTKPVTKGYWWDGCTEGRTRIASAGDVFYLPRIVSNAIVDCSDLDRPEKVGDLVDQNGQAIGQCELLAQDGLLYAPGKALHIYDIRSPSRPALMSSTEGIGGGIIGLSKGILYLVGGKKGKLSAVDVSDPKRPKLLSTIEVGPRSHGAYAKGYLYIRQGLKDTGKLALYDARNPEQLRFLKVVTILEENEAAPWGDYQFGWPESSGDYLFAANYEGGIYCIDISDPETPHFAGRARTGMQWKVGQVKGDYLYVPTVEGLWIVDIPISSQVPEGPVTTR